MPTINRRTVLKGLMGGTAVTVGLPLLDIFLNSNGDAMADGAALPVAFVSWFQGLGFAPGYWEPKTLGANYEFGHCLRALTPIKDKVNVYSGMKVYLDGHAAGAHGSGPQCIMQGGVADPSLPSVDQIIADHIGTRTRFRSLEVSCEGTQDSLSRRSASAINPSEPSPMALYSRIFGPEFKDPNAADFTPDPAVMARQSVLSAVKEQRQDLDKLVGAADKARLDEYFTSLRQLEQQLDLQLQKPAPLEACTKTDPMADGPVATEVETLSANHRLFAKLAAHAFACDQTHVVNLVFNDMTSSLRRVGSQMIHHIYTHEEAIDEKLGYQPNATYFIMRVMDGFADYLTALNGIREGDGTLLDRALIFAMTDTGYAKVHSVENMPMFTAGSAGGRMKTGIHFSGKGDPASRVGLTIQQALGLPLNSWGTDSMATSKSITEVLA